ncbi:MAG: hypothetical protein DMG38_25650 [Acidobacteria bacterium]|nr:MAG: hypothetical protein DMG38_25650 [Acidobacteriota bacterium]
MKHFTTEEWINFVNQVVSPGELQEMNNHLKQGCKRCQETVSMWQRVERSAAAERNYQPPADTVRMVKAAFAAAGLHGQRKESRSRISILFDSFLQPVVEGARSAATDSRQMLYRADPFQIDLQIEAKPDSNHLLVTGQLLDLNNPGIAGNDVGVTLSNLRGHVVQAVSNQHGEFTCEIKNSGDLQITFSSSRGEPIVISLRDALGRLPQDDK